ncbi:MAG TPA: AsmA family protein [Thiothrix sp.]|nr:AsmA family protein [Thiothrix sp.]
MKIIKILFTLILTLSMIAAGVLVFLIYTFDANKYKTQIVSAVKKQTGRDLTIDGDLKLSVFPDIAIELGKTSLSNATGFGDKNFADIGSGEISVKVMPLLKKEVKLDEIRLQDLKLNLQRKADGTTNWDDLVKQDDEPDDDKKPNEIVQEMLDNLSIAGISLQNAHIHWRDAQAGQDITLSPVNLKTGVFKPNSPLPIEFALTMKQKQPAMTLVTKGDTTITLDKDKQNFSLANLNLDTTITGEPVANGRLHAVLQGDVKGDSQRISVANLSLKTQLADGFIPKGTANTTLTSPLTFDLSTQTLSLPTLNLQTHITGDLIPEGKAAITLKGALTFNMQSQKVSFTGLQLSSDVDGKLLEGGKLHTLITSKSTGFNLDSQQLALTGLDLKADIKGGLFKKGDANAHIRSSDVTFDVAKQRAMLKQLTLKADANGELLQGAAATITFTGGTTELDLANTQVKIPALSLDTFINGGPVPSGKLTQKAKGSINLNWGKKTGGITLPSLSLAVANLQLKGSNVQLKPLAEKPSIAGQFQTNTFNLKQVLKMLGIEPPVTAKAEALTQVQASFNLYADSSKAALKGLKMKLDGSNVSGNFALNDFTQQAIVTALKIDRITLDDYLAPATEEQAAKPAQGKEAELMPLDTLKALNLDARLDIGNLKFNKLTFSNVHTQIKAKNGLVQLNPANANLYKGHYKGNITIDARQATPTMKMHHELIKLRSEGLLFDLFADRYLSGSTKLITDLSSRGNTMTSLLQNLNGKTHMSFKDGNIRDSKLAEKISLAVKVFEKKEMQGDKSVVTFTGLSGDWKTKQGVFNTDNLKLLSPYFTITGKGKANVAKQELDMKVRIGQVGNEKVFAPLHIYGSFSEPKFKLDLNELVKSLAKEDLEKAKAEAKERLKQAEQEAKEKLKQEEAKIKQRLEEAKAAKEQELRAKLDAEKERARNKLKDQLGETATQEIEKQLKDNLEDQVKDKLKDSLKSWF